MSMNCGKDVQLRSNGHQEILLSLNNKFAAV